MKTIERWLEAGFDKEGAYVEGVSYSGYGLSNSVLFADALRRNGKGDLFRHPTFGKLPEFYALSLLPGERVYDARNDSNYAGMNGLLLKLAEARQQRPVQVAVGEIRVRARPAPHLVGERRSGHRSHGGCGSLRTSTSRAAACASGAPVGRKTT